MDGESSKRIKLESILHYQRLNLNLYSPSLKDLREITNDFSDKLLIGQGAFGRVYKGLLQNGDIIAVKKLISTMPGLEDKQYENEARHLMRLVHTNIVQLVGYCSETEKELVLHNGKYVYAEKSERLLCLEYLPKGSLRDHISDASSGLDWYTRYKIIAGICCGLHYLHEEWKPNTPIVHRDLKPANILLDDNMVPKIADFGLSRLFGEEQTRTITKNFNGTLGYMAPEYLNRGIITKELDIFSLGVVIIQVVTGDKHYPYKDETSQEFIELVLKKWRNRLGKVQGYTSQEFDCRQIRRCIEIGLLCVKYDRAERPTTRRIIEMLSSEDAECRSESSREGPLEHPDQNTRKRPVQTKTRRHQVRQSSATITVTPPDDGFSWKKYGQKEIPGAKYPRLWHLWTEGDSRSQVPKDLLPVHAPQLSGMLGNEAGAARRRGPGALRRHLLWRAHLRSEAAAAGSGVGRTAGAQSGHEPPHAEPHGEHGGPARGSAVPLLLLDAAERVPGEGRAQPGQGRQVAEF